MIKAYKKIFIFITLTLICIVCMPFSYTIKGNDAGLIPYDRYIGYIIEPIQIIYDVEYETNISSDSTSSIEGDITNVNLIEYTRLGVTGVSSTQPNGNGGHFEGEMTFNLTSTSTRRVFYQGLYKLTLILDDYYVGNTLISLKSGDVTLIDQSAVPVNGNSVSVNFVLNSVVTNTSDDGLTLIVADMLNKIQNLKSWEFPFESFSFIQYQFNQNREQVGFNNFNDYLFPIFKIPTNSYLIVRNIASLNGIWTIRFWSNVNFGYSNYTNYFEFENCTLESINFNLYPQGRSYLLKLKPINTGTARIKYINSNSNFRIMPIYENALLETTIPNMSTEFALTFGFDNRLLHNLDLIVEGNTQTNNSVTNANLTNQTAQSTFNQEHQLAEQAEQDLSDKLDNLDIANKNNNLFGNSKFIASAQWVKDQFDFFTFDNAFGYLITFSLVIGISLVIIGKLRS